MHGKLNKVLISHGVYKLFQVNNVSKSNILIVEDDPDIQQLVTYNLIKAGMHVTCADIARTLFRYWTSRCHHSRSHASLEKRIGNMPYSQETGTDSFYPILYEERFLFGTSLSKLRRSRTCSLEMRTFGLNGLIT